MRCERRSKLEPRGGSLGANSAEARKAEWAVRKLARGGLSLLLRLSGNLAFYGAVGLGVARRGRAEIGDGRRGLREQCGRRVDQGAGYVGGGHGRGLQRLVMIEHPAGEHGFGGFLDPLVDQRGDFLAEICGVVEPRQFVALQRGARSRLQIVKRGRETGNRHGQTPIWGLGPKGPAVEIFANITELSRSVSSPKLWICCG
jgi:hypothetical protein